MKKKGNGGFLLSESLIVSTFVLTVIMLMFVQFKGIIVNNKKQYSYNSVENIYSLGSLAEFIRNNSVTISNNNVMIFTGGESGSCSANVTNLTQRIICTNMAKAIDADYIFYTDSDIDTVKSSVSSMASINQDMKDFVQRVNADRVDGRKRLIAKFINGNFATVVI